ncbi:diguanylate cyclase [Actinoplanes derwentensis]|uniref:Diguanylate cyclase (GGDEF) domain-containing protein n=1 Tax=Actinoplanes derwentensis TaxID=113562 RepID=A0A1H1SXU6_9ACTN|nr:diguanylate cyclase [Actinoplanes derwentensis]GID90069.1 serine/threonine protein kinase [Actinoplanes derwentensis]SDS52718.1 diguanylate cyclase (GGDEF) domain-containing protein [Actinoplanes derwentensis]
MEDVLYESERTRVVRVRPADGSRPVVRKRPLGPSAGSRLRNELFMLRRLAGVEGIPELADDPTPGIVAFVDVPSRSLASLPSPWKAGPLLKLAGGLATLLAAIHRRGVVHRDVSPGNILVPLVDGVAMVDRRPVLIDFELATSLTEDRFTPAREEGLAGTLPYLAPEQTGRTGRPVDNRADLYALGATLYELETGNPPFGRDGDPLQLVHYHLALMPVPPAELNPALPRLLSDITMRLLCKEPEQRYQSGEGLAYDLARLCGGDTGFPLGERDFPMRLAPPSRLIGRDEALATLNGKFAGATAGSHGVVLVTGPPGAGKTALVDRLRPAVTVSGGRFVTGKFDQYRRDLGADAVGQAFCALGSQLLTEPDEEVARLRGRLLEVLGPNASLAAAVMPPFAALLGVTPDEKAEDPRLIGARILQIGLGLLRTIASGTHPIVFFLDDLQWAGPTAYGFLDAVLDEPELPGLLVLGAFREAEVDEAHPLTAILARLRRIGGAATGELRLDNLSPDDMGALLAEMLRLPDREVQPLAELLGARTGGNPFDTVELVNALRREGALVPDGDRWRWDPMTLRRFVGRGDVVDLLGARIEALPAATREILEVMACLGGEVDLELLRAASGLTAEAVAAGLRPAAEDGLVTVNREGIPAASFRHDRVQQAAYGRMNAAVRSRLGLAVARRLATVPEHAHAAARQYLSTLDEVIDPGERRRAASVLRGAAAAVRLVANHAAAETFLAGALGLLDPADDDYRPIQAERHAALCNLGRFAEADVVYEVLEAAGSDPVQHAATACEQIVSLANRNMMPEALRFGLAMLGRLGMPVPAPAEMETTARAGLEAVYAWLAGGSAAEDLRRPEVTDSRLVAVAGVIDRLLPPAFVCDHPTMAWLVSWTAIMWAEHGPAAALVGPLSHAGLVTIPLCGDYRSGYEAVRRVLAVSEARGYEPATAQAKFRHAVATIAWFEPLEEGVRLAHAARDGLLRGGDLQNASSTYLVSTAYLLDCAPALDTFSAEVEAALALCDRIGNQHAAANLISYRQLGRALRGETARQDSFTDATFDEGTYLEKNRAAFPMACVAYHACRALAAALYGDEAALIHHSAASMRRPPFLTATYGQAVVHVLGVLAAAVRARDAAGPDRDAALADLRLSREFLAARAADQPGNFRHLCRLAEAETARLAGDFASAAAAYDRAVDDSAGAGRPWHAALIAERAGHFFRAHGLDHTGRHLLSEACRRYAEWGAHGKVRHLQQDHIVVPQAPARASLGITSSITLSADVIDLLAVLEAARALSSETDLARLRVRVEQVLSAMTGATAVHMVLWDDVTAMWVLPADADSGRPALALPDAAGRGLLPLTALRYAERTQEPMLVDDASRDDRVSRDPYFSGLDHCSLLVVPVLSQGVPRAMLVLENRLTRRAFSAGRLDAVQLIAGQLTVSLDNALAYASLERKVIERTKALGEMNRQLELLTLTDPLTGLANRRRLTDTLDAEWQRGLRLGEPIGLAMIDIDNFKKYNDHYGHQGGDECLRRVAGTLAGAVRNTDLVARYGGEEFAVIMPGTALADAVRVAERVRRTVADLHEPHALLDSGIVTISVGVNATTPTSDSHPDHLIKIADEALYQAKRGGRNRVATS